jgi:antitoxin (DNA-binding transcriptional repressor) of toxin-antitoxin stability system
MRIKQILAFLGAAAVSTAVLAAPVSVSADGNTVTVHGDTSPVYRLTPGQAQDTNGAFKLEDGRVLRLTNHDRKVFMEVDGKREELLPLSRTEFVAARSGDRVALDEEAFAGKVTLTQSHSK